MPEPGTRAPVTADDLDEAVRAAVETLRHVPAEADWSTKAGSLDWDCWETTEHIIDCLLAYAAQISPASPPLDTWTPLAYAARRAGAPETYVYVDRTEGAPALARVLDAVGGMLSALVRTKPDGVRAYHEYGISDPEGFAAMAIVETFVHMGDVTDGLELPWRPPARQCALAVNRLFPDVPTDPDPYTALLWATGRADLPGRERPPSDWRWRTEPLD